MTYNQIITLFRGITNSSKLINSFGTGELWEIEGNIKPGTRYPLIWVVPVSATVTNQTVNRTFTFLCMDMVNKDKSNEQEVLSDTELGLQDFIKVLRMESDSYTLLNEPTMFPFIEEFGDWCAGWRVDFEIETDFNSNDCDTTFENLGASIVDQDGNVLQILSMGDTYTVEVLQEIIDTITGNTSTVIDPI